MGKKYKNRKLEFDRMVYAYLVKRLREPLERSDAYQTGAVDTFGAPVAEDIKAFWAYTPLDRLVFNIRAALGDQVKSLTPVFDDVDTLTLMTVAGDPAKLHGRYDGIVSLVEELSYLPPEQRWTGEPYLEPESELCYSERVSRALTLATAMLYCMKMNAPPPTPLFGEVKESVESTFAVRSIGSADEIVGLMKSTGMVNGSELSPEGYVTLLRMARWIVGHDLLNGDKSKYDRSSDWKTLSTVGRDGV